MKQARTVPGIFLLHALREHSTPRQIACGIAVGIVLGLIPKANLTAASIAFLMFVCRMNLAAGLTSALAFTAIGTGCVDGLDRIGYSILTVDRLQVLFSRHYELPWVPWTKFNNTVVMGGLVIGLAQLIPTYCITKFLLSRSKSVSAPASVG